MNTKCSVQLTSLWLWLQGEQMARTELTHRLISVTIRVVNKTRSFFSVNQIRFSFWIYPDLRCSVKHQLTDLWLYLLFLLELASFSFESYLADFCFWLKSTLHRTFYISFSVLSHSSLRYGIYNLQYEHTNAPPSGKFGTITVLMPNFIQKW